MVYINSLFTTTFGVCDLLFGKFDSRITPRQHILLHVLIYMYEWPTFIILKEIVGKSETMYIIHHCDMDKRRIFSVDHTNYYIIILNMKDTSAMVLNRQGTRQCHKNGTSLDFLLSLN